MRIKLTENYFIEQSTNAPHLWDLYRKRTAKETGKQYETAEAYGLDLKQVVGKVPYFTNSFKRRGGCYIRRICKRI